MHKVEQVIKKSILLSYFRDLGKRNFLYPWTMILNFLKLVNGAKRHPLYNPYFSGGLLWLQRGIRNQGMV